MNLNNFVNRYVEVDGAKAANTFTIAGGAGAWIDTDISGSDVPANAIAIAIRCTPTGAQYNGARAHGGVTQGLTGSHQWFTICGQASRHVDFYRDAAQNQYNIEGYWI